VQWRDRARAAGLQDARLDQLLSGQGAGKATAPAQPPKR
jgi:hypothetical protein